MRKITIQYTPIEYRTINGRFWECQHLASVTDYEEVYDEYQDAVTGEPQPLSTRQIEVCDGCHEVLS